MKINKQWHRQHPMPKNPSFGQRVDWHLEHHQHCSCRPAPANIFLAKTDKVIGN